MTKKSYFRDVANYDRNTGEIIEDSVLALVPRKKINGFGEGWFAMNQGALKAFRESNLTGRDYDVLFAVLEILDFNNYIQLCQEDICKELNMKASHISRSIKKLVSIKALIEGPKISRSRTYRLDPYFGSKGSARFHHEAKESDDQNTSKYLNLKSLQT